MAMGNTFSMDERQRRIQSVAGAMAAPQAQPSTLMRPALGRHGGDLMLFQGGGLPGLGNAFQQPQGQPANPQNATRMNYGGGHANGYR